MPIIRATTVITLAVRHTCHAYGNGPTSAHVCTNAVDASNPATYRNWRAADASAEHLCRKTAAHRRIRPSARPTSAREAQGGLQPRPASASLGQPRPASASLGQSAAWFALAGHTGIGFHMGRAREEVHTAVGHSVQPEQVCRQQVLPLLRERVDSRALQERGGRTGRQRHLCREQADSAFGTAGAPEMFIRSCFGCPWLLSASADQPVGRHWTAISGVF